MSIKINRLEIENVKRVRAVTLEPSESGLTVIGGRNGQGKTSVLDAIAWALGGNRFRPSEPQLDESVLPPEIRIRMTNGLIVQRKGKNAALTVTDPDGVRHGQQLLDSFVEQLALDLPRFMNANDKEKADTLLRVLGIGDQLTQLERKEKELYNERLTVGRIADQKAKFAKEQPFYDGVPKEPVSASELIRQQQDILARNGENARKRAKKEQLETDVRIQQQAVERLRAELRDAEEKLEGLYHDVNIATRDALDLQDESTAELEANIQQIDEINRKVRANLDKDKAEQDAKMYVDQYNQLSLDINEVRRQRYELLNSAALPLPELTVEDGRLQYRGKSWDCMSGAEQLRVATAIVRRLNPECGFVLLDKLEQMDAETMREFGEWLTTEGLQAIATRVSSDSSDCTIIIEDGRAIPAADMEGGVQATTSSEDTTVPQERSRDGANAPAGPTQWKEGEF